MTINEALEKFSVGTELYVIKKIDIKWGSIRFYNTTIEPARYVVIAKELPTLWNPVTELKKIEAPIGTGSYGESLISPDEEYVCFKTAKEAEIWKVLELQSLDEMVEAHMIDLKKKTTKKLKDMKKKVNIEEYLEKYPEEFLKII